MWWNFIMLRDGADSREGASGKIIQYNQAITLSCGVKIPWLAICFIDALNVKQLSGF
jgi:hypothetical protein